MILRGCTDSGGNRSRWGRGVFDDDDLSHTAISINFLHLTVANRKLVERSLSFAVERGRWHRQTAGSSCDGGRVEGRVGIMSSVRNWLHERLYD